MSKQASNRKPLIVGVIAAVAILAVLLVLLLTQCTPGGGSGASNSDSTTSGKPVVENADLYWNVDRALYDGMSEGGLSSRRAESDGYFHVRFFKDGKMVELKVENRSVVNKLEVRDLMGLVFDENGIVVDVIPVEDMPVQKVGWKFYVQSVGGKIIKVNSSNKFDGLEILLETGVNTKVYDMTGTMGEIGCETTAVLNDRVMAVADLEGNLLAVYIYDRSNMVVEFQAHCQHCDMEVTWQEWDNTKQLPKEGGHFQLVTDVQLNAQQSIKADAKICLDLNGHTVDGKEGTRVYSVHNLNSELAVMDTSEEQTGRLAAHGEIYAQGCVIWARNGDVYLYAGTLDASDAQCTGRGGAAVYVPAGRFFYMYGGEIVGGTAKYYFNEDNGQYVNGVGGSLYVIGKFVMKDGVIRDGVAQSIAVWSNGKTSYKRGLGGNIFVGSGGEFVMDGGSIQNGRSGSSGNVYLDGTAEFTMNAGSISGGYVMDPGREGGNVNIGAKATFTMNGGVISYGTGNNNSGNVYCSGTFVMQGGMITGGRILNAKTGEVKQTAVSANMYLTNGSKLYMYGGTIHGRVAAVDGTAGDGKRTSIVLAGLPVIYNGTEGVTNLTLQPGKEPVQVTVLALYDLAKIGINASGKFTLETKEENRDNFISDIQGAEVLYVDKCLAVGRMACLCGSKTDKHVGDCNGEQLLWGPWTTTNGLPSTSGSYFLANDVAYTAPKSLGTSNTMDTVINLDLNGKSIQSTQRAFTVYGKLNLADHVGGGKIVGAGMKDGKNHTGAVLVFTDSKLNIYGGTIALADQHYNLTTGGVLGIGAGAVVNLYEGVIDGRSLDADGKDSDTTGTIGDGGAVRLHGTMNVYGGAVYGGVANRGGAFFVEKNGQLSILGGTVYGGTAAQGGAVCVTGSKAKLTISGGTVKDGTAAEGGNIRQLGSSTVEISGGTISGGVSTGKGGNISNVSGTLTVSGGKIVDGSSKGNGGNIAVGGKLILSGGFVSGGKVKDDAANHTANILVQNSVLELSGGEVAGGLLVLNSSAENKTSVTLSGAPVVTRPNTYGLRLMGLSADEPDMIIDGKLDDKASIAIDATDVFTTKTVAENADNFVPADKLDTIHYGQDECLFVGRVHCKCETGKESWCDHKSVRWSKWDGKTSLTEGNYYLTSDVTIKKNLSLGQEGKTLNICLNGHTITGSNARIMNVYGNVSIFDHGEGKGALISTGAPVKKTVEDGKTILTPEHSAVAVVLAKATLNVYGGSLKLADNYNELSTMGGVAAIAADGVMNIYGGSVDASASLTSETPVGAGGAIRVDGLLNVYGGQIIGGKVTGNGGAVLLRSKTAEVNVSGGTITGGQAQYGGAIYVNAGKLTVSEGTVSGGTANKDGGSIYAKSGDLTLSGGALEKGTASGKGGNIFLAGGSLTVSGGAVTGGTASQGGNIAVQMTEGSTIDLSITNGVISGGKALASNNANLYINNTVLKLGGGKIDGGVSVINTAGTRAWVELSGDPEIKATDKTNLRLVATGGDLPVVKIVGKLTGEPETIGITAPAGAFATSAAAADAKIFFDDSKVLGVAYNDKVLYLGQLRCFCGAAQGEATYDSVTHADWCDSTMGLGVWQPWDGTSNLTEGNYYLSGSVTNTKNLDLGGKDKTLNISLDGYTITAENCRVANINGNVNILDHVGQAGALVGTGGPVVEKEEDDKVIRTVEHSAVALVNADATLNLYGGSLVLAEGHNELSNLGGVAAVVKGGTMNIYGGKVDASASLTSVNTIGSGGAIRVDGLLNVYGGQIIGGKVTKSGGAVLLRSATAEVNVSGGTITGGQAENGGAIYVTDGKLTISGGTVDGGETTKDGGAIYVNAGVVTVTDGSIQNGAAGTNNKGGNVYLAEGAEMYISGGQILQGTAQQGGNIGAAKNAYVEISSGVIKAGQATQNQNSANIYLNNAQLMLSGGTIAGGVSVINTDKNTALATVTISGNPVVKPDATVTPATSTSLRLAATNGVMPTITVVGALTCADNSIGLSNLAEGPFAEFDSFGNANKFFDDAGVYVPYEGNVKLYLQPRRCVCGAASGANVSYDSVSTHADWCTTAQSNERTKGMLVWFGWHGPDLAATIGQTNFYLDQDTELTDVCPVPGSDVVLDLAGHTLKAEQAAFHVYGVDEKSGALNVVDSSSGGTGVITGKGVAGEAGGVIRVTKGMFNLYSGTVKLAAEHNNISVGGVFSLDGTDASVNIYGGTVGGSTTSGTVANGGTFYMNGGTLNIKGGTVNGGAAENGGAVYMDAGELTVSGGNLYAGSVTVGSATSGNGAAIYMAGGTVDLDGGTLSAKITGSVGSRGGIVYVAGGQLNIDGATINGAKAGQGGSIYQAAGTVVMTSGTINGGIGISGANHGGSVYVVAGATFQLQGGTVQNGQSENKNGGNFAVNGTLEISGDAQVKGGTAANNSGNIYVQNGVLRVSGNASIDGKVSVINTNATGSTVELSGPVTIAGADGEFLNLGRTGTASVPVVQITGALTDGEKKANVIVRLGNTTKGVFAEASGTYALTEADVGCFAPQNTTLRIKQVGTQLELYTPHLHCWCENADAEPADHTCVDDQEWKEVTGGAELSSGYYYLNWTGKKAAGLKIGADQTVYLCLNGASVRAQKGIELLDGATLYICDCSEGHAGEITTTRDNPLHVTAGKSVYLMSGKVVGTYESTASRVSVLVDGGSFYMYGGKLVDGCSNTSATNKETEAGVGGNLCIKAGQATIFGGQISGGKLGDESRDVMLVDGTLTIGGNVSIGSIDLAAGKTITIASPLTCADQAIGLYAGHGLFATGAVAADAAKFKNLSGTQEHPMYVAEGQLHMTVQSCLCGAASGIDADYDAVTHTDWCKNSGQKLLLWQPWDGTSEITEGNYYLNKDNAELTVKLCAVAAGTTLNLSLNGNNVKHVGETRAFNVAGTLNITDWNETAGSLTGRGKADDQAATVLVSNGGVLNLYKGTLKLASDHNALGVNGGTMAVANGGTVHIYEAGCVDASASLTSNKTITHGAAIRVSGALYIHGGRIIGGKATSNGGAVYIKDATSVVSIDGGTISAGEANKGDAICYANGSLTIGGNVSIGEIYLSAGKTITVKDNLTTTAPIPVSMGSSVGVFAVAEADKSLTYEDKAHFKSANTDYQVAFTVNGMELVSATVPATCACKTTNGTHEEWCTQLDPIAWTAAGLPTAGTYYLTDNAEISDSVVIGTGNKLNLWLQGHGVTVAADYPQGETKYMFTSEAGSYLALLDNPQHAGSVRATAEVQHIIRGSGIVVIDGANLDASAIDTTGATNGLAVYMAKDGEFVLLNGTITGGTTAGWGGAVYLAGGSTMRMSGGTVTGGTAQNGGNIGSRGLVYITGGNITNGAYTSGKGGNVYAEGNVEISGTSTVISGGKKSSGTTNYDRTNVVCWGSSLKLTDVSISGGVWVASNDNDTCTLSGNVTIGDGTNGLMLGVAASKKADAEPMPPATIVIDDTLGSASKVSVLIHTWSCAAGKIIATGLTQEQTTGGFFSCVTSGWALDSKEQSDGTYQLVLKAN